jgi:hypothetical protein
MKLKKINKKGIQNKTNNNKKNGDQIQHKNKLNQMLMDKIENKV